MSVAMYQKIPVKVKAIKFTKDTIKVERIK